MAKKAMANQPEQLYCSVDLEFTGFDPERDQILEIGFAFFKLSEKGLEVTEEWSQVFKPTIEVHPKILGLTGITGEELDEAPQFNDHREFLQEKLGEAIIVGHNPIMDVKFLESYGIKLSGRVIDTLELVQFILPTHHSYNLENLVHFFGVKHHKAHRALGDALSTIKVLEDLVRVYHQFPDGLRKQLEVVMSKGNFLWAELLQHGMKAKKLQSNDSLHHEEAKPGILQFEAGLVTVDTKPGDHVARVATTLEKSRQPAAVAVPDSATVMKLWRQGFAHGIFRSEDTFSQPAFEKFLNQATTPEELRFCLKVIVWLHTNWQTEAVLDLNISFFGGQFRQYIVGGQPVIKDEAVVMFDYATLLALTSSGQYHDWAKRKLIVCDIQAFEKFVSSGYGTRLSWNNVLYALRLIYNPETEFGNAAVKDKVLNALVATDLFFSLSYMLTRQILPNQLYASLSELADNHQHVYSRLKRAAENLKVKMEAIAVELGSVELDRSIAYLDQFFKVDAHRVKWITIDEHNLSFHDQPIDITENVKMLLKEFNGYHFTDTLSNQLLLSFLIDRLGLDTEVSELPSKTWPKTFTFETSEQIPTDQQLYQEAAKADLPLVIIMPLPTQVKDFYNNHYAAIKLKSALFAQGYSGGGNKMFRNFSINPKSILLLTADFMSKQNYSLTAKTVLVSGIPEVEADHPYIKALLSYWQQRHPELKNVLAAGKLIAALKKIKNSKKVAVKAFAMPKDFHFVDNPR